MLAIRGSVRNGQFASFTHNLLRGPLVTCPKCSETFHLYAAQKTMRAAEVVLIEYLARNCPRHVELFAADESKSRKGCNQCERAFDVLGLWQHGGELQIKAAYRQLAKKWHPDRISGDDEELRHDAEDHFREICNAYKHLTTSHV